MTHDDIILSNGIITHTPTHTHIMNVNGGGAAGGVQGPFTLTQVMLILLLMQVNGGFFGVLVGYVVGALVFAPDDQLPAFVTSIRTAIAPFIIQ